MAKQQWMRGTMSSPLEEFRDYLSGRGMRLTQARAILVTLIFSLRRPFTGESLTEAVSQIGDGHARISRSTTYRILQMLTDAGLLTAESASDTGIQYSHSFMPRLPTEMFSPLCQSTHADLIAGTCPWCGRAIFGGKPNGDI